MTSTQGWGMHGNIGYTWTDERIAILKLTWGTQSASEIAERIGMSRNAVCGKAWRLGLGDKATPKPTAPKPAPRTNNPFGGSGIRKKRVRIHTGGGQAFRGQVEMVNEPIITDLPPDQSDFACSIHDLTDGRCRYVLGAPDHDAMYCGADVCRGSWCGRHHRLVFTKPERSRDVG